MPSRSHAPSSTKRWHGTKPRGRAGGPTVRLRIGTRGSKLALVQAAMVRDALLKHGIESETVVIRTSGDRGDRDRLGAFVREIQSALLVGEIDVAVHCLKDLPTQPVKGLRLAAYLEREDWRDVLITRVECGGPPPLSHASLRAPVGAVIGTGSIRRTSQLLALRPDLKTKPLVGNVDSRLAKLQQGEYEAIILAQAGINRLGLGGRNPEPLAPPGERGGGEGSDEGARFDFQPLPFLPAPGQGVLVLETREDETELVRALNHDATEAQSRTERAFLAAFGGGCSVPIGALASVGEEVVLEGYVGSPDGTRFLRETQSGSDPQVVGQKLAERMIALGARDLIPENNGTSGGAEH